MRDSEPTGIFLATQDGVLDLQDIAWQRVAPCGCVTGVSLAPYGENGPIVNDDDARRSFCHSAAERQRDIEEGWTYRARQHKHAVEEMVLECEHTPKYGVSRPPELEGYLWAARQRYRDASRCTHLVKAENVSTDPDGMFLKGNRNMAHSLCGKAKQYFWSTSVHYTDGKVTCKGCAKRAEKIIGAQSTVDELVPSS